MHIYETRSVSTLIVQRDFLKGSRDASSPAANGYATLVFSRISVGMNRFVR